MDYGVGGSQASNRDAGYLNRIRDFFAPLRMTLHFSSTEF
jgi:hypothetical protein